jgi:hypothetical protein
MSFDAPQLAGHLHAVLHALGNGGAGGRAVAAVFHHSMRRWIEMSFGPANCRPLIRLESCSKPQLADRPRKSNGKLPPIALLKAS